MTEPRHQTSTLNWRASSLALVAAALSLLAAQASLQLAPWSAASTPTLLPIAQSYDARAARILRSDPQRSFRLTRKALALKSVDAAGWLRLAEISAARNGRLTSEAAAWLDHSFELAPYDAQLIEERLRFAYSYWGELSPGTQAQVVSHVKAVWPIRDLRAQLFPAVRDVRDPKGQFAFAALLFQLSVEEDVATSERAQAVPGS